MVRTMTNCQLANFNNQNVIDDLNVSKVEDGYLLSLWPIYGIDGSLTAKTVSIEFEPGIPSGSVYA
jgi:hypothetical protein